MADDQTGIWLKVSNARLQNDEVTVQLEGDRADQEPEWWPVEAKAAGEDSGETFRAILNALDKKRIVLARLAQAGNTLGCSTVRVQHTESRPL